jgi:hypothetical protein
MSKSVWSVHSTFVAVVLIASPVAVIHQKPAVSSRHLTEVISTSRRENKARRSKNHRQMWRFKSGSNHNQWFNEASPSLEHYSFWSYSEHILGNSDAHRL